MSYIEKSECTVSPSEPCTSPRKQSPSSVRRYKNKDIIYIRLTCSAFCPRPSRTEAQKPADFWRRVWCFSNDVRNPGRNSVKTYRRIKSNVLQKVVPAENLFVREITGQTVNVLLRPEALKASQASRCSEIKHLVFLVPQRFTEPSNVSSPPPASASHQV